MEMKEYFVTEVKSIISYFENCAPQEAEIIAAAEALLEKLEESIEENHESKTN